MVITIIDGQSVITIYGLIAHVQLPACCVLLSSELSLEMLLNHINGQTRGNSETQEVRIVSLTSKKSDEMQGRSHYHANDIM